MKETFNMQEEHKKEPFCSERRNPRRILSVVGEAPAAAGVRASQPVLADGIEREE